jgi:hypothetical protein
VRPGPFPRDRGAPARCTSNAPSSLLTPWSCATVLRADFGMWVAAAEEPPFLADHLDALADLSQAYAGRREFTAVTVTLESAPSPVPLPVGEPLLPRVRRALDWPQS